LLHADRRRKFTDHPLAAVLRREHYFTFEEDVGCISTVVSFFSFSVDAMHLPLYAVHNVAPAY
jgi:hypothetical protein